tara:strand:- start:4323 stop:4961 length:639 start_codon:yes stop_codon:yes gene_type:complete
MDKETINEPLLIVISSPSGAGKTSICKKILQQDKNLKISISATTRSLRQNESDSKDYHFISKSEFNKKIDNNEFAEYAQVFNNLYGSLKKDIKSLTDSGNDVIFDIDWQGTQQLAQSNSSNIVTIFILPPSKDEIEKRLKKRQVDSGDGKSLIDERMSKFKDEVSHWVEYDYVVINNDLNQCSIDILGIINSERKKRHRQKDLVNKVRDLLS